jgi:hypothetical protein
MRIIDTYYNHSIHRITSYKNLYHLYNLHLILNVHQEVDQATYMMVIYLVVHNNMEESVPLFYSFQILNIKMFH